ncbi:HipA family kinase [Ekhidna sp.]|uniref:HipA family kinase n=1 Tax=Ekhidna sp. TaxID=2608089 RepID=UPI003CCC3E8E
MKRLQSISQADKKFTTSGSQPFRILASDLEVYICKYPRNPTDFKLINELLGNQFAKNWGIKVPDMAFIDVQNEHIPDEMLGGGLSYVSLEKSILGSKVIDDALDMADGLIDEMSSSELRKFKKEELLKIALFDIWLSNDDRNHNNNNLLIKEVQSERSLIAIDHEAIFNQGDLSRDIFELSYEDSLLYSGVYHKIFKNSKSNVELIEQINASLYENTRVCNEQIDEILGLIPAEWNVDTEKLRSRLHQNIFSEVWLKKVTDTFKEHASLMLKNS